MTLHFFVEGKPEPQPRPRFTRAGHVYNPATAEAWKTRIRLSAISAMNKIKWPRKFAGEIELKLAFRFLRPKSHFNHHGRLKPSAPMEFLTKPDLDNLVKAAMDALTMAEVWRDDAQVFYLIAEKSYRFSESHVGLWVSISPPVAGENPAGTVKPNEH